MSTKSTSFLLVIWELHGDLGSKSSADVRGGKDWPSGGFLHEISTPIVVAVKALTSKALGTKILWKLGKITTVYRYI